VTNLDKIINVSQFTDGISVSQEGRESPDYYLISTPARFVLYLNWCLDRGR
jgi:hypothetical protein